MGWLYTPGMADSKPPSISYCPDIAPYVLSNGELTPQPPSWNGWKKRAWARVLCGMTLPPSTLSRGVDSWISSLRASRASHTAQPGKVFEKVTRATDGLTFSGLSSALCRRSFGRKTSQLSLPGVDIPSSLTWKAWVTELRLESTARQKLARHIFENASLFSAFWPTPNTVDHKGGSRKNPAKGQQVQLCHIAAVQDWATPTASVATGGQRSRGGDRKGEFLLVGQVKWGTPTARDWKGPGMSAQLSTDVINGRGPQGTEPHNTHGKSPGLLNPEWVEQLMGWAPGMSSLSISATEWSLWLERWRLWLFGKN